MDSRKYVNSTVEKNKNIIMILVLIVLFIPKDIQSVYVLEMTIFWQKTNLGILLWDIW